MISLTKQTSTTLPLKEVQPVKVRLNLTLTEGNTPLHQLAGHYHCENLAQYFDDFKVLLESKNDAGDTPLLYAAKRGAIETCRFLIEQGASPYCVDKNNFGMVHALAQSGDVKNLALLLAIEKRTTKKKGAKNKLNINALTGPNFVPIHNDKRYSCHKWTPLHFALHFNQRDMALYLKNLGVNIPAQAQSYLEQYELSLKKHPINIKPNTKGIWYAAKTRNLQLLEQLINQGAPYLNRNSKGHNIVDDALLSARAMPRLFLNSDLPADGIPHKNKIYITKEGCKLSYTLRTRLGCVVNRTLPFDADDAAPLTDDMLAKLTLQILSHMPTHHYFRTDEVYCRELVSLVLNKYEEDRKAYYENRASQSWTQKKWDDFKSLARSDTRSPFYTKYLQKSYVEVALNKGYSQVAYRSLAHIKSLCQSEKKSPDPLGEEYRSIYSNYHERIAKTMDKALAREDWYLLAHCINAEFEAIAMRDYPKESLIHSAFDIRKDSLVEKMVLGWQKTLRFESGEEKIKMCEKIVSYLHQSKNGYGERLDERRANRETEDSLEGVAKLYHKAKRLPGQVWQHVTWQQGYNTNYLRQTYSYQVINGVKTAVTILPSLASDGAVRFCMNATMSLAAPKFLNAESLSSSEKDSWLIWAAKNGAYSTVYYICYGVTFNAQVATAVCGFVGGSIARYALPEHLEIQGAMLGLSEITGTYAAWQGPLEQKIPSFYFERMRHEQWPAFIPATLETLNALDFYAKQILSVPQNPVHTAVQRIDGASNTVLDYLSQKPLIAPIASTHQWVMGNLKQTREQCLDQAEGLLLDHVMPATYINPDRKAFLAQQQANRWQTYYEELKNQDTQNTEQGIIDDALTHKLEDASAENQKAQAFADTLYHETHAYKAFATFQEDYSDYQQYNVEYEVAQRTNSANPTAQNQAIAEALEKRDEAFERMTQSREALKLYASDEALKTLDEESRKLDQETQAGIANILDDSALAPWIVNLIEDACSKSTDKNVVAGIIADDMIIHLFPFGGDANEIAAKREELINNLSTHDMRRWGHDGKKGEKILERAKDNMYQRLLSVITGNELKTRHLQSRTERVGTYIVGGASFVAAAGAILLGSPAAATTLFANGVRCFINKTAEDEILPLVNLNFNWDESHRHSGHLDVALGGDVVYTSAVKSPSALPLNTQGYQAQNSLTLSADPLFSKPVTPEAFIPQTTETIAPTSIKNKETTLALKGPEQFTPQTDFREVWDGATYTDNESFAKEEQTQNKPVETAKLLQDSGAPHLEAVQPPPAPRERERFHLPHFADGPKTGNAFIDGVDSFNKGVETARDAAVDAVLHPIETAKDVAELAFDIGSLVTEKTIGVSNEGCPEYTAQRSDS